MSSFQRPCLEQGCPNLTYGTRCPSHQRGRRAIYQGDWPSQRTAILADWRAAHGDWCPGFGVDAHASSDLTVDHVEARSLAAGLTVLCRACNGRKGATVDRARP